jgi:hypothetical protein
MSELTGISVGSFTGAVTTHWTINHEARSTCGRFRRVGPKGIGHGPCPALVLDPASSRTAMAAPTNFMTVFFYPLGRSQKREQKPVKRLLYLPQNNAWIHSFPPKAPSSCSLVRGSIFCISLHGEMCARRQRTRWLIQPIPKQPLCEDEHIETSEEQTTMHSSL